MAKRTSKPKAKAESTEAAAPEETSTPEPKASKATVEKTGSGSGATGFYVYECSIGDFTSRVSAEEVEAHIEAVHKG
jgi:uncharacterized cupin superfamily protein